MHFNLHDIYLSVVWVISTYIDFVFSRVSPRHSPFIRADEQFATSIDLNEVSRSISSRPAGKRVKIDRSARGQSSNSIRYPSQDALRTQIVHLGLANRILHIDTKRAEITVEPGVTMEQLVDALLPHQLVPFVVPEFKALTVGGVLAGAGLESSSWVHGQFSDHLVSARYCLSDGRVLNASPRHNADLFYGALGACGTLGLLVSATFKVQRIVTKFVDVQYISVPVGSSIRSLRARMETIRKVKKNEFLDAIVYAYSAVIIVAKLNHPGPTTQSFARNRDPWFYQHLADLHVSSDVLSIKDYLFRYDAGAFWMSQYAISPLTDWLPAIQYFIPPITDPYTSKILSWIPFGGYNWLSRWLLGPLLKTSAMYKRLHQAPVSTVADTLVIQDVYIPTHKAEEFLVWLKRSFGNEKFWLCPMRETTTAQILSPHYVRQKNAEHGSGGFINFGIWLHKATWQPGTPHASQATKSIERKVQELGGRKMLYSLSHYSRDDWNEIYDMKLYDQLKHKYDPEGAWGDIYDKIGKSPT